MWEGGGADEAVEVRRGAKRNHYSKQGTSTPRTLWDNLPVEICVGVEKVEEMTRMPDAVEMDVVACATRFIGN